LEAEVGFRKTQAVTITAGTACLHAQLRRMLCGLRALTERRAPGSGSFPIIATLLLLAAAAGAQAAHDPTAVLEQARTSLKAMAQNLEKYVCVETINRSYYQRVAPRKAPATAEPPPACAPPPPDDPYELATTDRVRLEVTVSEGSELHSWPGATRFDERNVDDLIRNGPVSTGSFGAYLNSVFGQPGVAYHFQGEQSVDGKPVFEYSYQVPLSASRFEVKTDAGWHPTAYEGEFRLDPQTYELRRLTVRTIDPPSGAAFCHAASTLDYQRVHIGDSDLLLPRQAELQIELKDGPETQNVTTFSQCREYQAESEIVFDESANTPGAAPQGAERGRVTLPIGLPVMLALSGPIDTASSAAGDPVDAKVVKPVLRPGTNAVLVPAGAVVRGRIRRVEHHMLPSPYFRIVLAFNRVEVNGAVSPFVVRSEPDKGLAEKLNANLELRDTGIWYWGVGTFLFPTNKTQLVIPAGFESRWFTLATGGR
jgi:hypothetical protein